MGGTKAKKMPMKNSWEHGGSIRIIGGYDVNSIWNKIFSYNGLSKLTHYDLKVGRDGHKVYMFDL